jgi:hypothetical protein
MTDNRNIIGKRGDKIFYKANTSASPQNVFSYYWKDSSID